MGVAIRTARPEDAAALATVQVTAWKSAYRGLMPDQFLDQFSVAERTTKWVQILGQPSPPTIYVALSNDPAPASPSLVGFCGVALPSRDEDRDDGTAEITALYVAPDTWRSGVGSALMRTALTAFVADGWRIATLWVLAGNARGIAFYEHVGFTDDGARQVHVSSGADEFRMRLKLERPTTT